MLLVYQSPEGEITEMSLSEHPVTLGRGKDADITIHDEKASRLHCGIKVEGDIFVLRDLRSKNGTYVNEKLVDTAELKPGDKIRIGSVVLHIRNEDDPPLKHIDGTDTVLNQIAGEMEGGKGYKTLLMELSAESKDDESEDGKDPS